MSAQMRSSQVAPYRGGNVAIEFGIVLPLLLLLTFGTIDLGRLLWTNTALTRGTQAAARCGALSASACPNVAAYAASQTWGPSDITASAFTTTTAACGFQVSATYNFQFTVPWFPQFGAAPPATTTLTATACYPAQSG
ncbi:MAG: TadE family protein [Tardiphaga sp.]